MRRGVVNRFVGVGSHACTRRGYREKKSGDGGMHMGDYSLEIIAKRFNIPLPGRS